MSSIATIRVESPAPIIRATVPLEPGAFDRQGMTASMALRTLDGRMLKTQWDPVVLEVDGEHVELAEIIAHDESPGLGPVTYDVVYDSADRGTIVLKPHAREAINTPPTFTLDGVPVQTQWAKRVFRSGEVARTRRFWAPNITGWVTVYDGQDVAQYDVVLHAAAPASKPLFFSSFALKQSWGGFETAWPEPAMWLSTFLIGLAPPRTDGKKWILPQRYVRRWRFTTHATGDQAGKLFAQQLMAEQGLGVADTWDTNETWRPLRMPFPSHLTPGMKALMQQAARDEWTGVSTALAQGTAYGTNIKPGTPGGRVGLFTPWGVDYGGSTGGADRELVNQKAVYFVCTGAQDAVRALHAEAAMVAYRTPTFLLEQDGSVCRLEDWIDGTGAPLGGWRINGVDGQFVGKQREQDGAFRFWINRLPAVDASEFDASEWDRLTQYAAIDGAIDHDGIAPIDDQHLVRYWSAATALALLTNDPFAGWMLRSRAEVWRMGQVTAGNAQIERSQIAAWPAHGTTWGRGQGHPLALCTIAHAISDNAWRRRWAPFLRQYASSIYLAQMLNGFLRAAPAYIKNGPIFFGASGAPLYAVTTCDEEVYVAVAAWAVTRELHLWNELEYRIGRDSLTRLAGAIWLQAWVGGALQAPHDYLAVRNLKRSDPPFIACVPTNGADAAEVAHIFALVLSLAPGDPTVASYVAKRGGLAGVLSSYTSSYKLSLGIDDDVFLIAALGG
jgi:hypothetical protein